MWFIVVCTLIYNGYASLLFSQTMLSYCCGILSEFAKVFERKIWRVQVASWTDSADFHCVSDGGALWPICFGNHWMGSFIGMVLSSWSYRHEVWCGPAGDGIGDPGLGSTIVSLHCLFVAWIIFFSCISVRVCAQFCFVRVYYLLIWLTCVFGSLNGVLILLCIVFLTHVCVLSVTVLTLWVAPPEMFCSRKPIVELHTI